MDFITKLSYLQGSQEVTSYILLEVVSDVSRATSLNSFYLLSALFGATRFSVAVPISGGAIDNYSGTCLGIGTFTLSPFSLSSSREVLVVVLEL